MPGVHVSSASLNLQMPQTQSLNIIFPPFHTPSRFLSPSLPLFFLPLSLCLSGSSCRSAPFAGLIAFVQLSAITRPDPASADAKAWPETARVPRTQAEQGQRLNLRLTLQKCAPATQTAPESHASATKSVPDLAAPAQTM